MKVCDYCGLRSDQLDENNDVTEFVVGFRYTAYKSPSIQGFLTDSCGECRSKLEMEIITLMQRMSLVPSDHEVNKNI